MTDSALLYKQFLRYRMETFFNHRSDPMYLHPVLGTNKFTNVFTALDRISQYMLKNVIYLNKIRAGKSIVKPAFNMSEIEIIKRIFLFNHFKTDFFWEKYLDNKQNFYSSDLDLGGLTDKLNCKIERLGIMSVSPFTNAYIVPGKKGENKIQTIWNKCQQLLAKEDSIKGAIARKDIKELFNVLKSIDGVGDFLASQVCFNFLWIARDWGQLTELGPGAKRGAIKLGFSEKACASYVLSETRELALSSGSLWITFRNKPILPTYADIQNTLCEFDKYCRLVAPELSAKNMPQSIKNRHKPGNLFIDYQIPGWWVGSTTSQLVSID